MNYDRLQAEAAARHLTILGGFHPTPADQAPEGCKTMLMLGPMEPGFWPAFTNAPEYRDGQADPMDRWSTRVVTELASACDAIPLFPFGGPPFLPFFSWALRTGRLHTSPIMLLVHDTAGLFVSFRGALGLYAHIDLPEPPPNPCATCTDKPCRSACPVDAFDGKGYDVTSCKDYLGTNRGRDCMQSGCAARRACPVSARYPRIAAQSAFHMSAFTG